MSVGRRALDRRRTLPVALLLACVGACAKPAQVETRATEPPTGRIELPAGALTPPAPMLGTPPESRTPADLAPPFVPAEKAPVKVLTPQPAPAIPAAAGPLGEGVPPPGPDGHPAVPPAAPVTPTR